MEIRLEIKDKQKSDFGNPKKVLCNLNSFETHILQGGRRGTPEWISTNSKLDWRWQVQQLR